MSSAVLINTAVHFLSLSKNKFCPITVIIFRTIWPWTPAPRCPFTQWQDTSTLINVVISVHLLYLFSLDMWLYFRTTWPQTGSCYHSQPLQAHSEPQLQLEKKKRKKVWNLLCRHEWMLHITSASAHHVTVCDPAHLPKSRHSATCAGLQSSSVSPWMTTRCRSDQSDAYSARQGQTFYLSSQAMSL